MDKSHSAKERGSKPRWSAEKRLEFIELKAYWEGSVNRRDIMQAFSVSTPQASTDLSEYQKIAPKNLRYDASAKRYVASENFVVKLTRPNAEQYLAQLAAWTAGSISLAQLWLDTPPTIDTLPIPQRPVDPEILRTLAAAIRGTQSVEIEYHSMNIESPVQKWRRLTPHAFGFDGFRWHVRAWCHRTGRFKDFLLSRCSGARKPGPPGANATDDTIWSTFLKLKLMPNPILTPSQRRAVEFDYGMRRGFVAVTIRLALLYYFDKHINPGLKCRGTSNEDARRLPIVVENASDYIRALQRIGIERTGEM